MIALSQPVVWESFIGGNMATATFSGTVKSGSNGVASKLVTVTITKPDSTKTTVTATTDTLGAFSAVYTASPGSYTAIASTSADAMYQAGASSSIPFNVGLNPVVITLSVSIA